MILLFLNFLSVLIPDLVQSSSFKVKVSLNLEPGTLNLDIFLIDLIV